MKTKKMQTKAPVIVLVVSAAFVVLVLGILLLMPRYEGNIAAIQSTPQNVNGSTVINYMPTLAEHVNWDDLSDGDKIGTARYAVGKAIDQAKAEGVANFNVLGLSAVEHTPVFIYAGGEEMTIYVNREPVKVALAG